MHRILVLFLNIICITDILYAENIEQDIQKVVKESIEKAELHVSQMVQDMVQKKLEPANNSTEGQLYTQFLQEQLGPYWKNVEQFCKNASNINNLPQMNIWIKIQQLEEQIIQLQQEIDSLKKGASSNS